MSGRVFRFGFPECLSPVLISTPFKTIHSVISYNRGEESSGSLVSKVLFETGKKEVWYTMELSKGLPGRYSLVVPRRGGRSW